jgi:hypothetical protein
MAALSSLLSADAVRSLGAVAVTLTLAGTSSAQVVVNYSTSGAITVGGGLFTTGPLVSGTSLGPGVAAAGATWDWNWQLPRGNFTGYVLHNTYLNFTVGTLPVRIGNLFYTLNGKWVNGGGTTTDPTTSVTPSLKLSEVIPGLGLAPIVDSPGPARVLNGNSLTIFSDSVATPSGYILAAGRTYLLDFQLLTQVDVTAFASTNPSITITNELGGEWSPGYTGVRAGLEWEVVPAPSAAGLLALAGLSAARRRR